MDMKEMYMEQANELAFEIYGKEFYELNNKQQDEIYIMAERNVVDNLSSHADFLRKQVKEG